MKLDILYFGLIAEKLAITNEQLVIDSTMTIDNFKNQLIKKYPALNKLQYQIALNQKIVTKETIINQDSEIALLPPFAGG